MARQAKCNECKVRFVWREQRPDKQGWQYKHYPLKGAHCCRCGYPLSRTSGASKLPVLPQPPVYAQTYTPKKPQPPPAASW